MQLGKFMYSLGGELLFDNDGNPTGIGALRFPDINAARQRTGTDHPNHSLIFCDVGPFTDPAASMHCLPYRRTPPPDPFSEGIYKLLRLFLQWIPHDTRKPPFVLTHPDLDIQNVIVTADGTLAALIDWDGVAATPRCLGNNCLPSWLTRDWDATICSEGREPDEAGEPCRENSPEELARYRAMYVDFIGAYSSERESQELAGRSLLIDKLQFAADDPICTHQIVEKVFKESLRARQTHLSNLTVGKEQREIMKRNFTCTGSWPNWSTGILATRNWKRSRRGSLLCVLVLAKLA